MIFLPAVTQSGTNSTDRLRECETMGGGGPETPKICVTSFMDGPKASVGG